MVEETASVGKYFESRSHFPSMFELVHKPLEMINSALWISNRKIQTESGISSQILQ